MAAGLRAAQHGRRGQRLHRRPQPALGRGHHPFQPGELWAARHELNACLKLGLTPSEYAGGRRGADVDWIDRAILTAWHRLIDPEARCDKCGRPRDVHKDDQEIDYHTAFYTCTATAKLDRAQKALTAKEEKQRGRSKVPGLNPERARTWFTYTDAEGLPR